jgi:hypothetical protein
MNGRNAPHLSSPGGGFRRGRHSAVRNAGRAERRGSFMDAAVPFCYLSGIPQLAPETGKTIAFRQFR